MREYVIYRHVSPDGKSYIGMTSRKPYTRRWRGGSSYKAQTKFYNAIQEFGWENFEHEILVSGLTESEAKQKEREMIAKYDSVMNGYNISTGGGGTYGIPCSSGKKAKIGRSNTGKPKSELSKNNLARWIKKNGAWNKGGHLTPEQYRKISEERKRRCNRAITAYNPGTMEPAFHFDSIADASRHFGVAASSISKSAHSDHGKSAGYIWRLDNENI